MVSNGGMSYRLAKVPCFRLHGLAVGDFRQRRDEGLLRYGWRSVYACSYALTKVLIGEVLPASHR